MTDQHHVYPQLEQPDVEVLVDDTWCPGEALMRTTHDDGTLSYKVQYRPPGSTSSLRDTFPAARVRLDTTDRSAGRTVGGAP